MIRQDLHPHRQSLRGFPARHAHARDSRQIARDRVDIGKIHRHRIVDLLAQLERRERRHRRHDRVHLLERLRVIARHQRPHLLRLQIIRVVVARAQHVGPQHDPPLALRAEPFVARLAIHLLQRARGLGAARIAHAVIARQIRARLRRADDVVACHRVCGVRQRDLADLASQFLRASESPPESRRPCRSRGRRNTPSARRSSSPGRSRRAPPRSPAPARTAEVASISSRPAITCSSRAESRTVRENGPIWSSELANAVSP